MQIQIDERLKVSGRSRGADSCAVADSSGRAGVGEDEGRLRMCLN